MSDLHPPKPSTLGDRRDSGPRTVGDESHPFVLKDTPLPPADGSTRLEQDDAQRSGYNDEPGSRRRTGAVNSQWPPRAVEFEQHSSRQQSSSTDLSTWAYALAGGLALVWVARKLTSQDNSSWPYHSGERWDGFEDNRRGPGQPFRAAYRAPLSADESWDLISTDKVEGTAVYDARGERLGSVSHLMVRKRSGQVAYAVLSVGGWLGVGAELHPVPWSSLDYEESVGGYVVNLNKDRLRQAPSHTADQNISANPGYWRIVRAYWI